MPNWLLPRPARRLDSSPCWPSTPCARRPNVPIGSPRHRSVAAVVGLRAGARPVAGAVSRWPRGRSASPPVVLPGDDALACCVIAAGRPGRAVQRRRAPLPGARPAAGSRPGGLAGACCSAVPSGVTSDYAAELALSLALYAVVAARRPGRGRWHADRAAAARRLAAAEARRGARPPTPNAAGWPGSCTTSPPTTSPRSWSTRRPRSCSASSGPSCAPRPSTSPRAPAGRPSTRCAGWSRSCRRTQPARPTSPRSADLADGFRQLGQRVTVDARRTTPPRPVAEALHGIAREALTNTLRYAPGRRRSGSAGHAGEDGAELRDRRRRRAAAAGGPAGLGGGRGADRHAGAGRRRSAAPAPPGPAPGGGWRVTGGAARGARTARAGPGRRPGADRGHRRAGCSRWCCPATDRDRPAGRAGRRARACRSWRPGGAG